MLVQNLGHWMGLGMGQQLAKMTLWVAKRGDKGSQLCSPW
jgi:hypothetical protein